VTIRGISSNGGLSGQTISGVPATAVYVDDVYGGLGGSYDIDRVEILRGPQGTLYGRSATAGLIAIHTRNPDLSAFSADASAEGGSYDLLHLSGAVNVPLINDELGLRVAANRYQRNGVDIDRGVGKSRVTDLRGKLLFRPSSDFSLLVGGALEDRQLYNGGVVGNFVSPDKIEYSPYSVGLAKLKSREVWAEANWDFHGAKLTYVPAYRTWTQNADVFVVGPGGGSLKQIVTTPHDTFLTQELRLASEDSSPIHWQTGLFYYFNDIRSSNRNVWEASNGLIFDAEVGRKTRDLGAFAEATVPLATGLRATAGIRYDRTTVETSEVFTQNANFFCYTPLGFVIGCAVAPPDSNLAGTPENNVSVSVSGDQGRRVFKNVTYKGRLEYDVSPTSLLYASVSTGFSPGDVQIGTGQNGLPEVSVYKSEVVTAYEIGSKNRFFDRRLQFNVNLFHYDYGGYQASILLNPTNPTTAVLINVPLRMNGIEAETQLRATSRDQIGVNFSYVDSKFHNLPSVFAAAVAQRKLWGFPPTTATAFYQHEFQLSGGSGLAFRAEANWRSSYDVLWTSPSLAAQGGLDYERQKPFVLGNLSLTWTAPNRNFTVTGYVRNVGNVRYKTYVNLQSVTPLLASGTQSDPRTWGVVLTAHY
jgi:iron complex outermembrane receptor protein